MKSGKTAFRIPHEIDQAAGGANQEYRSGESEQMYLTVNSNQRGKKTLNTSLSLYSERPGIVFCIEQDGILQVMHLLQEQNVILYARGDNVKFHSTEEPYHQ